ncbi:MAG: hypothetical protein IKA05_00035 [Clostridia bacterium]|nr:hypothetical protein [Clostridia bacterium]
MKNQKVTKRALLTSMMALVICFGMLLGTTYAWFTDTVTNGINRIVSGNLDISLHHADVDTPTVFDPVEADTYLFCDANGLPSDYGKFEWEPGVKADEIFRIQNDGTRALKFVFTLNFENASKTPDGKTLADILDVQVDSMGGSFSDSSLANLTVSQGKPGLEECEISGYLLKGEYVDFKTVIEWVPSDSDNEYNVTGGLTIDLGVTLLATQYTYEVDDEDDQYDANATFPQVALPPITTFADMQDALNAGGNYVLGANITLPANTALEVPAGAEVSFDLAGYDLITNDANSALLVDGTVTLINTAVNDPAHIVINGTSTGSTTQGIEVNGNGVLNIEDGGFIVDGGGGSMNIGVLNYGTVNIVKGDLTVTGVGDTNQAILNYGGTLNMNGGSIVVDIPDTVTSAEEYYAILCFGSSKNAVNLNAGKIVLKDANTYGVYVLTDSATITEVAGFEFEIATGAAKYGKDVVASATVNGQPLN